MQLHKMALTDNLLLLLNKAINFFCWSLFTTEGTKKRQSSYLNNFAFCIEIKLFVCV